MKISILNSQIGFGSIELLLWLGFTAVTLSIVIPDSYQLIRKQKFLAQFSELEALIASTRIKAMQQQQDGIVRFRPGKFEICYQNSASCYLSKKIDFELTINSSAAGEIRLLANGVASPSNIEMHYGINTCQLIISLRGRIQKKCHIQ